MNILPLWSYLYLFGGAFLISSVLVPLCIRFSRRLGIVDDSNHRKLHKGSIPLLGGVAIFLSFYIMVFGHIFAGAWLSASSTFAGRIPAYVAYYAEGAVVLLPALVSVALAGFAFFLIGFLDDKGRLSVTTRFLFEFAAAMALVLSGTRFELGLFHPVFAGAVTVLWIVGISNAFNLIDGLDGLAAGIAVICALVFASVMVQVNQPMEAMFAVVMAGSTAGFLRHNFHPAKIFMGSSGSLFLGYLLGVLSVQATYKVHEASPAFYILMPITLLAVPLFDTASVVLIRLREGRRIFKSDRSHTHHRLLAAGFSHRGAVLFMWLLTFVTAISAVLLLHADLWASVLLFLQVGTAFAMIILVKHVRLRGIARNGDNEPEKDSDS